MQFEGRIIWLKAWTARRKPRSPRKRSSTKGTEAGQAELPALLGVVIKESYAHRVVGETQERSCPHADALRAAGHRNRRDGICGAAREAAGGNDPRGSGARPADHTGQRQPQEPG